MKLQSILGSARRSIVRTSRLGTALLLILAAAPAMAAPLATSERGMPGSLMIMPEFDNRPGAMTMLTVTNTNFSESAPIEFKYVSEDACMVSNYTEILSPGDTLTLLTTAQHLASERGYVYVSACDATVPIKFDYLIGQSMSLNGLDNFQYSVEPFLFRAGQDIAHHAPTDLNSNGVRDFDGVEYEFIPNRLYFPRFLGQLPSEFQSDLILINLTGTSDFNAVAEFLLYNDNQEVFSLEYTFRCWERVPLSSISFAFDNTFLSQLTNHNPNEIVGLTSRESGWFHMDGAVAFSAQQTVERPALLAVMIEQELGSSASAVLPFHQGIQTNGSLLEVGDTIVGPPGTPTCFGTSCPCGNIGDTGEGCRNSTGNGALLDVSGTNSHVADDLKLWVVQCPPQVPGYFVQGGTPNSNPLGDGILCVGSPTKRLQFVATSALGTATTTISLAAAVNPGDTVRYQFWFRSPGSAGPCGGSSNLSNAYRVTWN